MSGILKSKKKIAALALVLVFAVLVVLLGLYNNMNLWFIALAYAFCAVAGVAVLWLNRRVRYKMQKMHEPFDHFSSIRNVDYLVIGDFVNAQDWVPTGKSYVLIVAPGRSMKSCYQILRHTHSILKEESGTVVLAPGNGKEEFDIFDIPFLHTLTIKKYQLEGLSMRSKYPIIFAPIKSVKFLIGGGYSATYTKAQNMDQEVASFCADRNYSLICLNKK